jgi:hypothetical protein
MMAGSCNSISIHILCTHDNGGDMEETYFGLLENLNSKYGPLRDRVSALITPRLTELECEINSISDHGSISLYQSLTKIPDSSTITCGRLSRILSSVTYAHIRNPIINSVSIYRGPASGFSTIKGNEIKTIHMAKIAKSLN